MKYTNVTIQGLQPSMPKVPTTAGGRSIIARTGSYPSAAFNYNPRTDPAYDVNWSPPNKPPLFIMGYET